MTDRLYTIVEAAEYLRLHPEVVRQKIRDGEIPARKLVGGQYRFTRKDLERATVPVAKNG